MASSHSSSSLFTMLLSPSNPRLSSSSSSTLYNTLFTLPALLPSKFSLSTSASTRRKKHLFSVSAASRDLQALIFDCDGVILESEHLHRQAYNDAFSHFNVRCPPDALESLNWGMEFYDVLQNQIGGGKPKMRWYFKEHGWPSSTIFETPPENDDQKEKLVDIIQVEFPSFWYEFRFPDLFFPV